MATSRLKIYNDALILCGERTLSALTENREGRYLLDQVWDNDGVRFCLESGQWRFASRTIQIDYDTGITPDFGYLRAFPKPSDWCATLAISEDEYLNANLIHYNDENGYWYADVDTIYVRYVSDHADWGNDLSIWPAHFSKYVSAYFAEQIALKITADEEKQDKIEKKARRAMNEAKNHDMMGDPAKFPPEGSWSASRRGRSTRDRGRRTSLTG